MRRPRLLAAVCAVAVVSAAGAAPARGSGWDGDLVETRAIELACNITFADGERLVIAGRADADRLLGPYQTAECQTDVRRVDFGASTLLGIRLDTGWCRAPLGLTHTTVDDRARRRYVVTIGYDPPSTPCRARSIYDLWLLVPKLPDGYEVEFVVTPSDARPE